MNENMNDINKNIAAQVLKRVREEEKLFGINKKKKDEIDSAFIQKCLYKNELGDALLYSKLNHGCFLYVFNMAEWLVWTGHHWDRDIKKAALAAVEKVALAYHHESLTIQKQIDKADQTGQKDKVLWLQKIKRDLFYRIKRLRTEKGRINCLKFVCSNGPGMSIRGDEIDQKPWLLAFKNGVIDLISGDFRDGEPEEYLLKASPHEWKGYSSLCINWLKCLLIVFQKNKELIRFLQHLVGLCLVGKVVEHKIIIFYGQGRNGKSVIVEILLHCLGELAAPVQSSMLLDQGIKNSSGPTPDIMSLKGRRVVIASETDEGRRMSASKVKLFVGGDSLVGRNPHDKYETSFQPTHSLFLLTNHLPHASSYDFALWERIILIPFELSFVNRECQAENERPADPNLLDKLKSETPGILAWMVKGCLMYQQEGLNMPVTVKQATGQYRKDEDVLYDFVDEEFILKEDGEVGATDAYIRFEEWYERNISKNVPKQKRFGKLMTQRFKKAKVGGSYKYFGLELK